MIANRHVSSCLAWNKSKRIFRTRGICGGEGCTYASLKGTFKWSCTFKNPTGNTWACGREQHTQTHAVTQSHSGDPLHHSNMWFVQNPPKLHTWSILPMGDLFFVPQPGNEHWGLLGVCVDGFFFWLQHVLTWFVEALLLFRQHVETRQLLTDIFCMQTDQ